MKKKTLIVVLSLIFVISGCEKTTMNNVNVKTYIKLLKSGNYDLNNSNGFPDLPPFEPKDIPELLTYANDTHIVTKYPHNTISSFIGPDPRLGVFVLWTIESIRLYSAGPDLPLGRYPSSNPILMYKEAGHGTIDEAVSHQAAAQAYQDWFNSHADFEQIKGINPLENTEYRWR